MINTVRMPVTRALTREYLNNSPRGSRKFHHHSGPVLRNLEENGISVKEILKGVPSVDRKADCLAEFADNYSYTLWRVAQAEHYLENMGQNGLVVSSVPGVWYAVHLLCMGSQLLMNESTRENAKMALEESNRSGNYLLLGSLPIRPVELSPESPETACALWRAEVYGKTAEDMPDRSQTAMGIAVSGTPGFFSTFEKKESPLSYLPDNSGANKKTRRLVSDWVRRIINRGGGSDLPAYMKFQLFNRVMRLSALGAEATCGNVYIASMPFLKTSGGVLLSDHILKPCKAYGASLDGNEGPHTERKVVYKRRTLGGPLDTHTQERLLSCRSINDPALAEKHGYRMANVTDIGINKKIAELNPEIKPLDFDESRLSTILCRNKIDRPSEKEQKNAQIHREIRQGVEGLLLDMGSCLSSISTRI